MLLAFPQETPPTFFLLKEKVLYVSGKKVVIAVIITAMHAHKSNFPISRDPH